MLITLVAIYAPKSPANVSITGKAVILPPPNEFDSFELLSKNLL
jgi:hypothetical protein